MNKSDLLDEIASLLKQDNTQQVFKLLDLNLIKNSLAYDDFVLLNRRFNKNKTLFLNGTLEYEKYLQEDNRVISSTLSFVKGITSKDIKGNPKEFIEKIDNPILVICPKKSDVPYMKDLFSLFSFSKVRVEESKSYINPDDFDLVVFDNRDLPDCFLRNKLPEMNLKHRKAISERVQLLEEYLIKSEVFMIHFGNAFFGVTDNRDRIYAANSKFSLFSRTKEMIEFIKTYRT